MAFGIEHAAFDSHQAGIGCRNHVQHHREGMPPLHAGAALLARCAPGDRGKEMISLMFATQRTWVLAENPLEHLTGHAKTVGLEGPNLEACLKNEAILNRIVEIRETALRDLKVQSTPTFFIGEDMKEMVEGADYPPLKAAIDKHFS